MDWPIGQMRKIRLFRTAAEPTAPAPDPPPDRAPPEVIGPDQKRGWVLYAHISEPIGSENPLAKPRPRCLPYGKVTQMVRRRKTTLRIASVAAVAALMATVAPMTWAEPGDITPGQQRALDAGLQIAPKKTAAKRAQNAPNPYLANLPTTKDVNYSGWKQRLTQQGTQRAKSAALAANRKKALGRAPAPAFVYDEEEPTGSNGSNDSRANAELVSGFGTGRRENPRVRILGSIANLAPPASTITTTEDNGSIPLATDTGIDGVGAIRTQSTIGDGPYGGEDGSNDFDFFEVTSEAGLTISASTLGTAELDTIVVIYSAEGEILAANDDALVAPNPFASRLNFRVPADGDYYVMVAGFGFDPLPADPFNSGSGAGGSDRGDYSLSITSGEIDTDFFALRLDKGDVIGAVGRGAANTLTIYRPDGTRRVGASNIDASSLYAPQSPLPGGGNTTLAYVAEQSGLYRIRVDGSPGTYDTLVEAYRPGSETDTNPRVQTVFLDFDGARVNTGIFGGPGVRELSPFRSFVARWGLTRAQEATLINRITATVRENIQRDLVAKGLNKNLAVRVINSKDSPDSFGKANVSRVIVGGTIEQSGIPTIGIAQYIDPGNYGHEDTALVLLDVLSGSPADYEDATLNYYLRPSSDRVAFVSRAVANVISHEIGHYIGNYHTDNTNDVHNLMDAGGGNFGVNLYGVGPDGIGGTADDEDIDFRIDTYDLFEGFTGRENTLNVSAWAFVRGAAPRS